MQDSNEKGKRMIAIVVPVYNTVYKINTKANIKKL